MSLHVIVAMVACLALVASGVILWKGLGDTPAARKLPYELVPLVQLAMVTYAAVCASIWSDGIALSYVLSALGLIQAGLDPLLAKGLAAAERADASTGYADAINEQLAAQRAHLDRSAQAQKELRSTKENLAEQFADVVARLEGKDLEGAKQPLETAERSIPIRGSRLCRNAALDALLQEKQHTCNELGIVLEPRVGLDEDLAIPITEACAILANLLDNAINACKPLADDGSHPTITLAARETHNHLVLKVENPYAAKAIGTSEKQAQGADGTKERQVESNVSAIQSVTAPNGAPSKLDLTALPTHGWGTGIVRALVSRHNGSFETEATDGHFTATVLIPTTQQEVK